MINRAYKQFFSELVKENKKLTIVLSKQKQANGNFCNYYNKAIRKMDSQIKQSEKNLIQGIKFIKKCMSDDFERKKYQDQIINFLGDIKWYKNVQNNLFHSIIKNIELQKVTEQIYQNFIFIYGMIVKQKLTRFTFRRNNIICCTISDDVRLRTKPFRPDSQKIQPTGQPTCVLTQTVPPSRRLIKTVSMYLLSFSS